MIVLKEFKCYVAPPLLTNIQAGLLHLNLQVWKNYPLLIGENRVFKLCIHRRNFLAAWNIMWNINNAIKNSNSAIIVMSQDYLNSLWCKEEFEQCYFENMKDPAFKVFVVMMQPSQTLNINNEYVSVFFI